MAPHASQQTERMEAPSRSSRPTRRPRSLVSPEEHVECNSSGEQLNRSEGKEPNRSRRTAAQKQSTSPPHRWSSKAMEVSTCFPRSFPVYQYSLRICTNWWLQRPPTGKRKQLPAIASEAVENIQ